MESHKCPWCKQEFAFYQVKESVKLIYFSCAKCGYERKVKKQKPKLEATGGEGDLKRLMGQFRVIERRKFYYARRDFPLWQYKSGYAIGMNLDDFHWKNEPFFTFKVKNVVYQIDRKRAFEFGRKYHLPKGVMPYLIPMEEFKILLVLPEEPNTKDFTEVIPQPKKELQNTLPLL
ncbi:MAG: lysine biosynthesis protein [Siphoviridae sp. cttb18]|nr:MAG: lysine biosynthesis protein [Siphoviridae sp. cttb18]